MIFLNYTLICEKEHAAPSSDRLKYVMLIGNIEDLTK